MSKLSKMEQGKRLLTSMHGQRQMYEAREREMLRRAVIDIGVPPVVRELVACNADKGPLIMTTIAKTVRRAMEDPRTRPLFPTDAAFKDRLEIVYDCLTRICGDGHAPIKLAADRLWDMVLARMAGGGHPDDIAEQQVTTKGGADITGDEVTDGTLARAWGKSEGEGVGIARLGAKDMVDFRDQPSGQEE
jgi:hypothetical protein